MYKFLTRAFVILPLLISTASMATSTGRIETDMGDIQFRLYDEKAPNTVSNFIRLIENGYFKNQKFNSIIKNHSIQFSDASKPKYCLPNEFGKSAYHQKTGILSMIRSGADTHGSSFMITMQKFPHLDGYQSAFGEVTKGLDIAMAINQRPTKGKEPVTPIRIKNIVIEKKSIANKKPQTITVFSKQELQQKFLQKGERLFKEIASAMALGKLEWFELSSLQSRCSEVQMNLEIDFSEARGSQMLTFAKLGAGELKIDRFQFKRGQNENPHKNSPLHKSTKK